MPPCLTYQVEVFSGWVGFWSKITDRTRPMNYYESKIMARTRPLHWSRSVRVAHDQV
jgi:hypothetical protein